MDKWAECRHVLNEAVLSDHGLNGLGRVPEWNTLRRDRHAVEKLATPTGAYASHAQKRRNAWCVAQTSGARPNQHPFKHLKNNIFWWSVEIGIP